MSKKEVSKGNEALMEAAVRAGCRFYSGYPITPQTTATEYLSWRMSEVGGQFVQAESELAAINMLAGASMSGTRSMTATSGPGLSLMTETLSVMCGGRIPGVIVDIQRYGAGIGGIQGGQSDYYMVTKTFGHGGLTGLVYAPLSTQESIDLMVKAFDKSEEYRVPVVMLTDGSMGQMMEAVTLPDFIDPPDLSDQPYVAGTRNGRAKRTIYDTPWLGPNANSADNVEEAYVNYEAMVQKWDETEVMYEEYMMDDAEYVIFAWGTGARVAKTAVKTLREEGHKVGLFRPITLLPFPKAQIEALSSSKIKAALSVEMAIPAQFYHEVRLHLDKNIPLGTYNRSGGYMVLDEDIADAMKKMM